MKEEAVKLSIAQALRSEFDNPNTDKDRLLEIHKTALHLKLSEVAEEMYSDLVAEGYIKEY